MTDILWNVRLLDLETGSVAEARAVTLDDGRIAAIDPADGEPPPNALDLAGTTLLPGLIDAHCHVLSDRS